MWRLLMTNGMWHDDMCNPTVISRCEFSVLNDKSQRGFCCSCYSWIRRLHRGRVRAELCLSATTQTAASTDRRHWTEDHGTSQGSFVRIAQLLVKFAFNVITAGNSSRQNRQTGRTSAAVSVSQLLFYCQQLFRSSSISTVSMVRLKTKFKGVPSIAAVNLCWSWGGLGLCQSVFITGYIVTHDVILLLHSQSQWSL